MMTTTTGTNDDKLFVGRGWYNNETNATLCVFVKRKLLLIISISFFILNIVKYKMLVRRCCHLSHCVLVAISGYK